MGHAHDRMIAESSRFNMNLRTCADGYDVGSRGEFAEVTIETFLSQGSEYGAAGSTFLRLPLSLSEAKLLRDELDKAIRSREPEKGKR